MGGGAVQGRVGRGQGVSSPFFPFPRTLRGHPDTSKRLGGTGRGDPPPMLESPLGGADPPQCPEPRAGAVRRPGPASVNCPPPCSASAPPSWGENTNGEGREGVSGCAEALPPRCHLSPTPPGLSPCPHNVPVSPHCAHPRRPHIPSRCLCLVPVPVAAAPQEPHDLPGCLVLLEGEEGAPGGNGGDGEDPSVPRAPCPQRPPVSHRCWRRLRKRCWMSTAARRRRWNRFCSA